MNKLKMALFVGALVNLFACTTTHQPKETIKSRFLKNNISQAELNIIIVVIIKKLAKFLI